MELILKNIFYVIIVYNYLQTSNSLQIISEAWAQITAKKSQKITEKWINLFLMRPPPTDDPERKNNMTAYETFTYNLEQLNIKVIKVYFFHM